jgi:MFS family permease
LSTQAFWSSWCRFESDHSCAGQDKLIITAAIPQITTDFASTSDIGWYGTAYLLTNCAFLLVFGKVYSLVNIKPTFLVAIVLFEIGSAVCGAAPNSVAFIVGRAIAGLGAGGVQSGVVSLVPFFHRSVTPWGSSHGLTVLPYISYRLSLLYMLSRSRSVPNTKD